VCACVCVCVCEREIMVSVVYWNPFHVAMVSEKPPETGPYYIIITISYF